MKKKCLLTILFIIIAFGILSITNSVSAYDGEINYSNVAGIQQFVAEDAREMQLGKTIALNLNDMYQSTNLYCVQHDKESSRRTNAIFRVINYIEINHNNVISYHFPNANSNDDAANDYSRIDISEVTTEKESSAAALALALSGCYGQTRYRTDGVGDYTETQKAVWPAFYYFVNDVADGMEYKVGNVLGLDDNTGSLSMVADSEQYRLQLYTDLQNGATAKVRIYFLRCIDGGTKGASQWQQMMIAIPEVNETTVTINKVDGSTNKPLSRVSFIIKSHAKNQYIQNIAADGTIIYTSNESEAYQFTTGVSTYAPIVIKDLEDGFYTIKEIQNLNTGYNTSLNIGKEQVFQVNPGAMLSVTIQNYADSGDDDDDDDWEDKPGDTTGNITISGTVWDDGFAGKGNRNNNKKDTNEKGISGIRVYWKDNDGNIIASTKTDSEGKYKMYTSITVSTDDCSEGNDKYDLDEEKYKLINKSYIEFEYNGLMYTTVKNYNSGTDKSRAIENTISRTTLDNYFDEINKDGVINNNQLKYRLSYNTSNNEALLTQSKTDDFLVKADTNHINKLLDKGDEGYAHTKRDTSSYHDEHDTDYDYDEFGKITGSTTTCETEEKTDEWDIQYMNLGLVHREQPDIAITSDIDKVRVIMKGQEYTYDYNVRNIRNDVNVTNYCVSFEKKYSPGVYSRPVNPSDIAYIQNAYTESEMQVYVTYVMRVKNQSNTLPIKVKEIVNYYDDDYEITSSSSATWSRISKYGNMYQKDGYNAAYTTVLQDTTIEPGQASQIISIEYKVNNDAVKSLINKEEVLLRNVVEINAYTTYYGANTQCAENKTASSAGKTGAQYAGVDLDSAPGNATPGTPKTYEDDTEEAPIFQLMKNPEYKIISGTVWEDTDANGSDNERLGNGVKNSGENHGVKNVKVELLKTYDEGEDEPAYIYRIENGTSVTYDAITYTDSNGHYEFEGIVTDNYILKFTYGDDTSVITSGATTINGHKINARNYKSTIITQEPIKSAIQGNGDDKWHLTLRDEASIAVDDLDERLDIPELKYSNYNDPINMSAYSASFRLQVEYTEDQFADVDENGGEFENELGIFDFGIIERPREDIVIEKTIENLKITLANGQVLTEGNPYKESMNYVKALGTKEIRTRQQAMVNVRQKMLSIEMDSELIQGATLDILYAITVTNNSEKDYEYDSSLGRNENYYYYGDSSGLPLIKPSAEIVVDYVDTELTCTTENEVNKNWMQVQSDELKDLGYISEATCNKVKEENFLIFATTAFKDIQSGSSHTEYLFASKLLANQADDHVYENHAEIVRLNGKIARTIDSVKSDGTQVTKTYKPGDYVPSLNRKTDTNKNQQIIANTDPNVKLEQAGLHEQDDDMIRIVITPPTGSTNNIIIYIIAGGVGLLIIAIGVWIIKKKII